MSQKDFIVMTTDTDTTILQFVKFKIILTPCSNGIFIYK